MGVWGGLAAEAEGKLVVCGRVMNATIKLGFRRLLRKKETPKFSLAPKGDYVYVLHWGNHDGEPIYKIGFTGRTMDNLLQDYVRYCPFPVAPVRVYETPNAYRVEQLLKKYRFDKDRVKEGGGTELYRLCLNELDQYLTPLARKLETDVPSPMAKNLNWSEDRLLNSFVSC